MMRKYCSLILLLASLYLFSKLTISTVAGQLVTYHREYVDCSLPETENVLVVQENGTIQRCENGLLELKYCFAGITKEGEYECVEHESIRKTMEDLPSWQKYFIDRLYVENSEQKLVDCRNVWSEHPKQLYLSPNKQNCLRSLGDESVKTAQPDNQLCFSKNHKILYFDEWGNVKFCENFNFKIKKCAVFVDERIQCIQKDYIPRTSAPDIDSESFCSRFSRYPTHYLPNFKQYLEDCSYGLSYPGQSKPQAGRVDTPQYIDCSKPEIVENYGVQVLIDNESSWYECSAGRLQLSKCITRKETYKYRCVSQAELKDYFKQSMLVKEHVKYYIGENVKNDVDCSLAVTHLNTYYPDISYDECSTLIPTGTTDENYSNELCIFHKQGYSIVGHGFYECNGLHLQLTKCMVYTGEKYLCVSKQHATVLLDFQFLSDKELCDEFATRYDWLNSMYIINTMACNDPLEVPHHRITATPAPTTRTTELAVLRPEVVTTSVAPRTCSLTTDNKPNRLADSDMSGKCIDIDDFIQKFDSMTPDQLMQKINYQKLSESAVDVYATAKGMTLGDLFQAGRQAHEMLSGTTPTEAAINLVKLFKEGSNDCDILRQHLIVHKKELCDIIKDCDQNNPMPPPRFC